MRPLALTAAALHVVVSAVAAFLMFFVATFPFENQSIDEAADDWLIGAVAAVALLALVPRLAEKQKNGGDVAGEARAVDAEREQSGPALAADRGAGDDRGLAVAPEVGRAIPRPACQRRDKPRRCPLCRREDAEDQADRARPGTRPPQSHLAIGSDGSEVAVGCRAVAVGAAPGWRAYCADLPAEAERKLRLGPDDEREP